MTLVSKEPIPDISLTSFLQYISAQTQLSKMNSVKRTKKMYEDGYQQSKDAYRRFRRQVSMINGGVLNIDKVVENSLPRDKESYELLAKNHNKIFADVPGICVKARKMSWTHNELAVRVNPEVAFQHNDVVTFYKLHLKVGTLRKGSIDVIFQMLIEAMSEDGKETAAIADLRSGRILTIPNTVPDPRVGLALQLDAEQFVRTWYAI